MGISYGIIIFGLPLTYAYATLWQSVAGNSTFRGIVFCNLGTAKTDVKIRHQGKYSYVENITCARCALPKDQNVYNLRRN